jgi:hypothetical protein
MVDEFGALFAKRPCGECVATREWNLADGSQAGRSEKAKRALVRSESQDGHFVRLDAEILADQVDGTVQSDGFAFLALASEFGDPFFKIANVFAGQCRPAERGV